MTEEDDSMLTVFRTREDVPVGHVIDTPATEYRVVKTAPHPSGGFRAWAEACVMHATDIEGRRLA